MNCKQNVILGNIENEITQVSVAFDTRNNLLLFYSAIKDALPRITYEEGLHRHCVGLFALW